MPTPGLRLFRSDHSFFADEVAESCCAFLVAPGAFAAPAAVSPEAIAHDAHAQMYFVQLFRARVSSLTVGAVLNKFPILIPCTNGGLYFSIIKDKTQRSKGEQILAINLEVIEIWESFSVFIPLFSGFFP